MKLTTMFRSWELSNRFAIGLLAANVLMAFAVLSLTTLAFANRERVILVPPHLDKKIEMTMKSASSDYFKSIALYVATLIGNITPHNVEFVAEVLSTYLESDLYAVVRTKLLATAKDPIFQSSGGSSWFTPTRIDWEKETAKVFVIGELYASSAAKAQAERKPVVYEMEITMDGGMPKVVSLDSYEDTSPHTLQWKARNEKRGK